MYKKRKHFANWRRVIKVCPSMHLAFTLRSQWSFFNLIRQTFYSQNMRIFHEGRFSFSAFLLGFSNNPLDRIENFKMLPFLKTAFTFVSCYWPCRISRSRLSQTETADLSSLYPGCEVMACYCWLWFRSSSHLNQKPACFLFLWRDFLCFAIIFFWKSA